MSSYSKMVLISELEYLNLRNFKYLPHDFERRGEGFDEQPDETEVFLNATTPQPESQPAESQPAESQPDETPPRNVHLDDDDDYDGYDAYQARNDDFRSFLNTPTSPAQSQVDLDDEPQLPDVNEVTAAILNAIPNPAPLEKIKVTDAERAELEKLALIKDRQELNRAKRRILMHTERRKDNKELRHATLKTAINMMENNKAKQNHLIRMLDNWWATKPLLPKDIEDQMSDDTITSLDNQINQLSAGNQAIVHQKVGNGLLERFELAGYEVDLDATQSQHEQFGLQDEAQEDERQYEEEMQRQREEDEDEEVREHEERIRLEANEKERENQIRREQQREREARVTQLAEDRRQYEAQTTRQMQESHIDRQLQEAQEEKRRVEARLNQIQKRPDYLKNIPPALHGRAQQLIDQLERRGILDGSTVYPPHERETNYPIENVDVPRLIQLCVRDTHRKDDNLQAGPRTTSAFEMIQAHGRHDPDLTAYFGASLLRAFRRDYPRAEIQPSRLTIPTKIPRTKIPRMGSPRQPRTVLDYSDDDDFTVP